MKILCLLLVPLSLIFISCKKESPLQYREWTAGNSPQIQQNLLSTPVEKNTPTTLYKNKKIQFSRQLYNGKPIYGSFIKTVSTDDKITLIQAQLAEDKKINSKKSAAVATKPDYAALLKSESSAFAKNEIISIEEVFVFEADRPVPYTLVSVFDRNGNPFEALFSAAGKLKQLKRTGSQFADLTAAIFPEGPKLSTLTDELFRNVSSNPALSNMAVTVTTESSKKIDSLPANLKLDPKDDRFDQLQVFYYINKTFLWAKETLNIKIPNRIEAVVFMGYPDKTNSAFYFQNKIRLGKGDDVTYSNLAHDATVVYHETFHSIIDNLARLPFEGEGGSLNEAFADFFTCLMTERPYLGESSYLKGSFKRNLSNNSRLSEKSGGLYHDSLIISGLLWNIKEKIGADKARSLATEVLIHLNTSSQFSDFSKNLIAQTREQLNADDATSVLQIMQARGFEYE